METGETFQQPYKRVGVCYHRNENSCINLNEQFGNDFSSDQSERRTQMRRGINNAAVKLERNGKVC